jgi:Ca-activated chloride channel family protein
VSEFRFADPQWAHALWGVLAFVALLLWLDRRGGAALERLIAGAMRERLVRRPAPWRRRLAILLLGVSAGALVVSLMRPQWGVRHVATPRVGAEIMIALDVSRSMLAEDVAPNRLERAKAEITDLLAYLDGDHVGLIAFAGRSTVLAPLTPDFGFLRLVLEGAGPHSVSRGGTRLEEPIRKAVEGFGTGGTASRAILLITDGEDHDSFALDAAKAAAEAGVVIVAIGFGDEAGSEINVTDPRTGARSRLRDDDGQPVVSRLDGELLRELALATGGAYVPAGTGVLDLESIYERHVSRLTRGELDPRGRSVRNEAYQWFVLLAFVCLVSSAAVAAGRAPRAAAAAAAALLLLPAPGSRAQPGPATETESSAASEAGAATADPATPAPDSDEPEDPRELYNRGVEQLERLEYDDAERSIGRARREARGDGELRFHASYNLGWLAMEQGGRREGESPQEALGLLYRAADWFREAVRERPEDEDARANLEVALRRALVLADRIAREGESGLEAELEALTGRQRKLVSDVAALHVQVEDADDPHASDRLRREFRGQAAAQRSVLSEADPLAARVAEEGDAIESRPDEERTPEDAMRRAQLANVLHFLHRARERMGQARRQLRQRQGERAYRRAAAALRELKRAQDQLRDPAAVLDALLRDTGELSRATEVLALTRRDLPGPGEGLEAPAWLTRESLEEGQRALAERADELHARLRAGLDEGVDPGLPPEQQELRIAVQEAEPFVGAGAKHFHQAARDLGDENLRGALLGQHEGRLALVEARERFLDLRGLIEAARSDEQQIEGLLASGADAPDAERREYLPALRAAQAANLRRAQRLGSKVAAQIDRLEAGLQAPDPANDTTDEEAATEAKRFAVAERLLSLAMEGMRETRDELASTPSAATADGWKRAHAAAGRALAHLDSLRRLFFSIVEHVRDLARQQLDLADATQDALALSADPDTDAAAEAQSLVPRQSQLAERSLEIANALAAQSDQAAATDEPSAEDATRRLRVAGEHVLSAQDRMEAAAGDLGAQPPGFEAARSRQDEALVSLREALALLEPPRAEPPQPEGSEGQGSDDAQPQASPDEAEQPGAAPTDPAQLLQAVRDREAQRRRDRERAPTSRTESVEKDW